MILIWHWCVVAALAVLAQSGGAFVVPNPADTTTADDCLNKTQNVAPSIVTSHTEPATYAAKTIAQTSCTVGYTWDGSHCVRSIVRESYCNENYELVDGSCQIVENAECPVGFHRSGAGACEIRVVFDVKCPPEHEWSGQTCIKKVQGVCPVGTVLENNMCVHTRTTQLECQPDFEIFGELCVQRKDRICDPGYKRVNGECVFQERQPGVLECPANQYLEGIYCVSLQEECRTGYEWNGTMCVNETIGCPPDFNLDANNRCVQVVCNPVDPICEIGYELRNGQCYKKVCDAGFVLKNNTCIYTIICAAGTVWDGTHCRLECSPGFVNINGECLPDVPCPEGSTFINGSCYQNGKVPFCPPNYKLENDICVCTTIPFPTTTSTTTTSPPPVTSTTTHSPTPAPPTTTPSPPPVRPVCPIGYVLRPNGICEKIQVSCPLGQVLLADGTCQHTICPFGYERHPNGLCHLIRPVCADGYRYHNGACYPIPAPAIVNCPNHETTQNTPPCQHNVTNNVHIDNPVNVVNKNENNFIVHLYEDGQLIKITRNNETEYIARNSTTTANPTERADAAETTTTTTADASEEVDLETEAPNCCRVVSPRKCIKSGDVWNCTQRESHRCGWYCTSATIYLKPRRTVYRRPVLVMRPPPSWHRYANWGQQIRGGRIGMYICTNI